MKTKVMLALTIAAIFLMISISGCQLPQYEPADTAEDDEVSELTEELNKLTSEIEGDEADEVDDAMTDEEKAKEEFRKKLLEKQAETDDDAEADADADADSEAEEADDADTEAEEADDADADAEEETVMEPVQAPTGKVLKVTEGDLVQLKLRATDPDGDALTYSFTAPLDDEGAWQTGEGDAGTYKVTVSVSDGKITVDDTLTIEVEPLNRPPTLAPIADITVDEGDTVTLGVEAKDPEGEKLTFSYSGWMSSPTYTTTYDDAGTHKVTVTVSDGLKESSQTVTITVLDKNRAPELTITW